MPPLHCRGHELMVQDRPQGRRPEVRPSSYDDDQELLEYVAKNLEYLTTVIDALHLDDLPRHTQRHVVGVGERFRRLLWKVARVVSCYHGSQAPCD